MVYEKTQWKNGSAPGISAEKLNNIEDGVETAYNVATGGLRLSDGIFSGLSVDFGTSTYAMINSGNALIGGIRYIYDQNDVESTYITESFLDEDEFVLFVLRLDLTNGQITINPKRSTGSPETPERSFLRHEIALGLAKADPEGQLSYIVEDKREEFVSRIYNPGLPSGGLG